MFFPFGFNFWAQHILTLGQNHMHHACLVMGFFLAGVVEALFANC